MIIYFGADHGGADLKRQVIEFTKGLGYEVFDVQPTNTPDDDYPDMAGAVAKKVAEDPANRKGILFCHSGAGMAIAATKVKGIRSTVGLSPDQVFDSRNDDDVNVLAFAADFTDTDQANAMVKVFLNTPFNGDDRFVRRLEKIREIEEWPRIV